MTVAAPTISISPTTLPAGTVGASYAAQTLAVTGGTAPYSFVFSGILPPGITFDTTTGEIAGTPNTQSNYSFTVEVTDSSTGTGPYSFQTSLNITIAQPTVVLTPADGTTLTAGLVGAAYSDTSISATGGSGDLEFSADNPADLPDGLSIATATGAITGTPTQAGTFVFTVWAAGTMGGATSAEYTIVVANAAPTITVAASDSAPALGASVTFTATLAGGSSPSGTVTFKDGTTTLGTGTISGTTATYSTAALAVGAHSITAEYAGDGNNAAATSNAITVTVAAPVFIFNPAAGALSPGEVNTAYSQAVSAAASGSTQPVTYTLGSGALPAGISLDAGSGVISGVPSQSGNYTFTIVATDSSTPANSGEASYTLAISPAVVMTFTPASGSLPQAMAGEDYDQTISATGGSGALTYSVVSGALPDGMVINASTGELTGPVDLSAEVKDYTFT